MSAPSLQEILTNEGQFSDSKSDSGMSITESLLDEMEMKEISDTSAIVAPSIKLVGYADEEMIESFSELPVKTPRMERFKRKFAFVKKAYSWMDRLKIVDIVSYSVVIGILVFIAIPTEKKDLYCPDMAYTKDKTLCRDGNGGIYYNHRSNAEDSIDTSIEKIRKIVAANKKLVKWRRCYIFAFVATILIFMIIFRRMPKGIELLISVSVITMIFYLSFNYYGFHHDDHVNTAIYGNLNKIESELDNYTHYPQVAGSKIKVPESLVNFLDLEVHDK